MFEVSLLSFSFGAFPCQDVHLEPIPAGAVCRTAAGIVDDNAAPLPVRMGGQCGHHARRDAFVCGLVDLRTDPDSSLVAGPLAVLP